MAKRKPNPVYGEDDENPVTGPDLRAQEGIGGDADTRKSKGSGQGRSGDNPDTKYGGDSAKPSAGNGSTTSTGSRGRRSSGAGAGAEEEGDNFKFDPKDIRQRGNMRMVLRAANKHRKITLVGTGVVGGSVGTVVVVLLMLIPLKIEHIISNLQGKMFASSENAVSKESENMLSDYVKRSVLPALTKCRGTSIAKNCNPAFGNVDNPVDAMYKGWSQARLENKLATDYGIEFRAVKNGAVTKYYMKAPGIANPNGDDITKFQSDGKDLFQEVSRGAVRDTVTAAFENETSWKKAMYRYKVGRLLEEKYGINRCNIWCGQRDALQTFPAQQKNAAQIWFIQKVIVPFNQTRGIVMECLFNPSCDAETTQPTTPQDGSTGELAGAPENANVDQAVRTNLTELAQSYGVTDKETIQKMIDKYNNISANGYQQAALQDILSKIGLGDLSGTVLDKATLVGWVNQVFGYIGSLKNSGPELKKLDNIASSTADIKVFTMYQTQASEIHMGKDTATEVGSFVTSFSSGTSTSTKIVGGTAGAEEAPLWNPLINNTSSTRSKKYLCSNNKSPAGLVCPEEKLGGGNQTADAITSALDTKPLSYLTGIATAWNSVFGGISGFFGNIFGSIIGAIPGVKDATGFVANAAQPFLKFLEEKVVRNSFGVPEGGGRLFQQMAGGAEAAGNTFAHTGLGAAKVTTAVAANIAIQQQQQAQQDFSHESFFARMFSTDSQYSLVSRVAMDIPLNIQTSGGTTAASMLSNPLAAMSHSFASIFSGKASADAQSNALDTALKAFDDTPYAYLAVPAHAKDFWAANCSDNAAQAYQSDAAFNDPKTNWNDQAAANPDPNTGMPSNSTPNPCLLIKSTVCSAGVTSDTSLCTADDLGDVNGGSGSGNTGATSTGQDASKIEQGSGPDLAKKLLGYQSSGQYKCDNPGDCTDLKKVADGQSLAGSAGCIAKTLDPRVIQLLLYLIEVGNFKVGTYAMCGDHSSDGPRGHSGGFAVDISSVNGQAINQDTQAVATQGLAMDKFLNNLPPALKLNQQISYGYGNHPYQPMADLQQAQGKLCTSTCVSFYTLTVEGEHENHIHAGF